MYAIVQTLAGPSFRHYQLPDVGQLIGARARHNQGANNQVALQLFYLIVQRPQPAPAPPRRRGPCRRSNRPVLAFYTRPHGIDYYLDIQEERADMGYTKEQLADFAALAAKLRTEAHRLEAEQTTLNEHGSAEGDRHWMLGTKIRLLRDEANRVYAPVLDAIEDDIRNDP